MKKLEDIKKENIYQVPDGYFDNLPMRIQSRISDNKEPAFFPTINWNLAVKVAIPSLIVVVALVLTFFNRNINSSYHDVETILAQVSSEDLVDYLQTTDISLDEILDEIQYADIADEFANENLLLDDEELSNELYDELIQEYGINEI